MPTSPLHAPLLAWYRTNARDLPWRRPEATPWAVLVSEVMLQQTQVSRVLPVYEAWLRRWPTPGALAGEPSGEAVRMWGRLGYPRRAIRLHQAAEEIERRYDGVVPSDPDDLRRLPGIGAYTAAAVGAFAFRQPLAALDTNVRRVLTRLFGGEARSGRHLTKAEQERASAVLPDDGEAAARWSVALMELGALVCTSRAPRCGECPVAAWCAWHGLGHPPSGHPTRPSPGYRNSDRHCRGDVLAALRDRPHAVAVDDLEWPDRPQLERAIASLVADRLVAEVEGRALALR